MPVQKSIAKLRREAEKRNESMDGGVLWRAIDFLVYLVLIILIMFAIRGTLIDPVRVDGESMLDTLKNNEIMLIDRAAYAFSSPKRGEIVLCYYPDEYYAKQNFDYASRVKRVIALGGETIFTIDGKVYVTGVSPDRIEVRGETAYNMDTGEQIPPLDEPYLTPERVGSQYIAMYTVPEGCVYVLGDNRAVSRDSRNTSVQAIPLDHVVGRVRLLVYPFERMKIVK